MDVQLHELEARLQAVKAKRGYLLPHHGLLAITSQRLLEAYDAAYTALALEPRVLDLHDRETVWLAILMATDEALATHHLPKFREGGGTDEEIAAILRLAAWAIGAPAYRFVAEAWSPHLPGISVEGSYREAFERLLAPLPPRLGWMAVAAVHACKGDFDWLAEAIVAAYDAEIPEVELAEALSLVMFPGSVPTFVEAARVWLRLVREGRVAPSPAFAAWARLEGQGGFDEAAGVAGA